jgi:ATP phosphoribosyltransferase
LTYNKTSTENDKNIDKLIDELKNCNYDDKYSMLMQNIKKYINKEIQNVTENLQRNPKVILN